MSIPLSDPALAQLFTEARTLSAWKDQALAPELLHKLYELTKFGPTSANCSPARFVFVHTPEGKQRLAPALSKGNLEKTMSAPVCVIAAWDAEFFEKLPMLFPFADARSWFTSSPALAEETAFRNSSLQAAYLIMAARGLGLDAGPMSGFDRAKVDAEFFAGQEATRHWRSNFLINLGYGDRSALPSRAPRLSFDDACQLA